MKRKIALFLGVCLSSCLATVSFAFSQEAETKAETATAPEPEQLPQIQWLYGEVVSIDEANKVIVIKHVDYETDQEKQVGITVDENTNFENSASLGKIKPGYDLSIDFITTSDGKNLAKNISVEVSTETADQQLPLDASIEMNPAAPIQAEQAQ